MEAGRASTTAVLAVLAGVALVTGLTTWAASIGPGAVLTGDGPATHRVSPSPSPTSPSAESATPTQPPGRRAEADDTVAQVIRAFVIVAGVAAVLLLLLPVAFLWRWLVERYRLRRRREPAPEEVDFDVLDVASRVSEEIGRDAARQRELLLGGTPRNGIVECWHRFEAQASTAGLSRLPWETSAEFTMRMLDLVAADLAAVARLSELYREARFSDHPVDERDRAAAVAALDVLHAGLASTPTGPPGRP